MKTGLYLPATDSLKQTIRHLILSPIDIFESITGKRPYGVPPRRALPCHRDMYLERGKKLFNHFRQFTALQPGHAVLDVDPHYGEFAVQLSRYLNEHGFYQGLNHISAEADFCKRYIVRLHPNFSFQLKNIYSPPVQASGHSGNVFSKFGLSGHQYDRVFLSTAIAHLLPAGVPSLLEELSQVMKPGSKCIMQLFIVNCESENLMLTQPAALHFPVNKGLYRLQSKTGKLLVAYDEEWLFEKLENAGLKMESIKYGSWCGRKHFFEYEDMLICSKV